VKSERHFLRDAVGLALAVKRGDWGGYNHLADAYRLDHDQRHVLSTAIGLLVLRTEVDLERFALYLTAGEGE
jgi:hypothetical protein